MTTVEIVTFAIGGFVAYAITCGIALRILKAGGFSGDPEPAAATWPMMLVLVVLVGAGAGVVWLGSRIALGTAALPGVISRRLARRRPPRHAPPTQELPEARTVRR